ncbi:CbiX/SirB N-terminal domain-containing protein [Haloterrigena alkaliphila]|uniref:Sirohydrochlorin ferrochelatase n=1 Tax=Haloterrigena alkaliphila TaxID=2816475 RepID=A0A8A2VLB5_9EURY|nr:CbiX/SirB N-terminal domain-containing protein [Haloterrigena alkaliphila]QSX01113.1 hypothetical protein J0X25_09240 [Haloterrigena alkaliphila]
MIDGTLIVIGRETGESNKTIETHVGRLRERDIANTVRAERFDETQNPAIDGDGRTDDNDEEVFVVPMSLVETNETRTTVPRVASAISDAACLCGPIGQNPAITDAIADRAAEQLEPGPDVSLVLVGLGSSSMPHERLTIEYHERRLRDQTGYGEVTSAYLVQDPAVECARYNATNDRIVVVPVFITPSTTTEEEIPAKLELDRDDVKYTDPLGTHPRVTDAIHSEVAKQHVLQICVDGSGSPPVGPLNESTGPAANEGMGSSR